MNKLNLAQYKYLSQEFDGVEFCPHCDMETYFKIIPVNGVSFKCEYCGNETVACSLCDGTYGRCGVAPQHCQEDLCKELLYWKDKESEEEYA